MTNYIYKACKNSIVTMELLARSGTNETRSGIIDPNYAKFRTDKVKVVSIINVKSGEMMSEDVSNYARNFIYRVGKIISCRDYDFDDTVCSRGIHYFKTYEAALSWYYRNNPVVKRTNGTDIGWYASGQKEYELNYKDGKQDGKEESWYRNGQKRYKWNFKDRKQDGKQESWFDNGQKWYEGNYKDGNKDGKQERWYNENGQKWYEENYKDGKPDGKHIGWYQNGAKEYERNYKDGTFVQPSRKRKRIV